MKIKSLLIIAILTFGVLTSCQEESHVEQIDLNNLEQDYLANLHNDVYFQNFINSLSGLINLESKDGVDLLQMKAALDQAQSKTEIVQIIQASFDNSKVIVESIDLFEKSINDFKNPDEHF